MSYGGGIKTVQHAEKIITLGYEKIILNSACFRNSQVDFNCQKSLSAQSVIVCVDIIKIKNDYFLYNHLENKIRKENIKDFLKKISSIEIGEIILSVDWDVIWN